MSALWLTLGTLTRIPVPMPARVDRSVAGWSLALSPVSGAALAGVLVAGWTVARHAFPGASPFLVAVLMVGALAWLTRGMHLDGLADVADGLGSGKPAEAALAVMKRSDIGPFGVVTLLLTVLLQVAALSQVVLAYGGMGTSLVLVAALVCSRGTMVLLGTRGYAPARDDGLGRTVAQSVTAGRLTVGLALIAATVVAVGMMAAHEGLSGQGILWLCAGGPLGILAGLVRAITAQERFGGVTGDVYGAAVETAFTAALVTVALGSAV